MIAQKVERTSKVKWYQLPPAQPDVVITSAEEMRAKEHKANDEKVLRRKVREWEEQYSNIMFDTTKLAAMEVVRQFNERSTPPTTADDTALSGGSGGSAPALAGSAEEEAEPANPWDDVAPVVEKVTVEQDLFVPYLRGGGLGSDPPNCNKHQRAPTFGFAQTGGVDGD